MPLSWTPEARAAVHGPRHRLPSDPVADDADAAWQKLCALGPPRMAFASSERATSADLQTLERERAGKTRPQRLDVAREALRALLVQHTVPYASEDVRHLWPTWAWARHLVDLWAGVHGARFVVEVLTSPVPFEIGDAPEALRDQGFDGVYLVKGTDGGWPVAADDALFWALRNWLSSQSDAVFAREHAAVAPVVDALDGDGGEAMRLRVRLCWALAQRDCSCAERLKSEVLRRGAGWEHVALYSALTDAASALDFFDRGWPDGQPPAPYTWTFDVVDAYGEQAVPVLQRLLHKKPDSGSRAIKAALQLFGPAKKTKTSTTTPKTQPKKAPTKKKAAPKKAKAAPKKTTPKKTTPKKKK